jgi:hypothetical protein
MYPIRYAPAILSTLISIVGCASVTTPTSQTIRIDAVNRTGSSVSDVRCDIANDPLRTSIVVPGAMQVMRASSNLTVRCFKQGEPEGQGVLMSRANSGMAGNILVGGVVGAVVDHTTGSGYSYPSHIQIVMGHKIQFDRADDVVGASNLGRRVSFRLGVADPNRQEMGLRVGDQFSFVDYEPISKNVLTTETLRITAIRDDELEFDAGKLVMDWNGNWLGGEGVRFSKVFKRDAKVGDEWVASLISADGVSTASVNVRYMELQQRIRNSQKVENMRFRITGYANGPLIGMTATDIQGAASIAGEVIVDARSGIPLSVELNSRVRGFALRRLAAVP